MTQFEPVKHIHDHRESCCIVEEEHYKKPSRPYLAEVFSFDNGETWRWILSVHTRGLSPTCIGAMSAVTKRIKTKIAWHDYGTMRYVAYAVD